LLTHVPCYWGNAAQGNWIIIPQAKGEYVETIFLRYKLVTADGIVLTGLVLGGPVSTLISFDPAIADEAMVQALNPELDVYTNPQGGQLQGCHI
jgi:hypothetical protein